MSGAFVSKALMGALGSAGAAASSASGLGLGIMTTGALINMQSNNN